ncbi:YELLOW STRIPE like 1 [Actinidia rufa]|uniref:YELLOW STRIPE like 1 n=1 Tax=Actinidia rufa TaxID=165716 RepID=A0A7J0D865_9ERIC|nr:YELLOW STRIPE like 1 [Actinidia rufa]
MQITTSVGSMGMETEQNGKKEIEDDGEELHELEYAKRIPPWTRQITLRGVIGSFVIGGIYSVIAMKLNLTTGMTPNLNVSAALLGYIFMRTWTKMLQKFGIVTVPFTRKENTMIQTCDVACYGIAVGGGFGSYLLGLNKKTYELAGVDTVGNSAESYKEPGIGWMVGFLFVICFVGLFVLIPLRKTQKGLTRFSNFPKI